jgi:hypothetical protein
MYAIKASQQKKLPTWVVTLQNVMVAEIPAPDKTGCPLRNAPHPRAVLMPPPALCFGRFGKQCNHNYITNSHRKTSAIGCNMSMTPNAFSAKVQAFVSILVL